jgi:hypothetical protein
MLGLKFQPALGAVAIYQIHSIGKASMDYARVARAMDPNRGKPQAAAPTAQMEDHTFDLNGQLHVRFLAREGDGWRAVMRLQHANLAVNGAPDTRTTLLESEFNALIGTNGQIRQFAFPVQFPEDVALAIRGMVEPLQVVFGAPQGSGWTSVERSAEGMSKMRYDVTGTDGSVVHLKRARTAMEKSLPSFDDARGMASRSRTVVEKSSGDVDWSTQHGRLQRMAFTETVATYVGGTVFSRQEVTYSAALVSGPVASLSTSTQEAAARLSDETAARTAFYRVDPQAEKVIKNLSARDVVAATLKHAETNKSEASFLMSQYVRGNPAAAAEIVDRLASVDISTDQGHDTVGLALSAVAMAGNKEAQKAVVDLLARPGASDGLKELAMEATLSMAMPERFVPAALWAHRESLSAGIAKDSPKVAAATNVYGAAGGVDHGVKGNTEEVVTTLSNRLRSTHNVTEQRMLLVALGNVGDVERVLPATEGFFRSDQEILRMRAFETFHRATGDVAFRAFADKYQQQTAREVRMAASGVAQVMPPSAARAQWAAEQLAAERDPAILYRLVDMLGRDMKQYPNNEKALRTLLETTKDRELRKKIYSFVSPMAGGAR